MSLGIIMDVTVLVALAVTLFIGIRLSRQFARIRADQERMGQLVNNLNAASQRAENAVQSMKKTAIETGETLQGRIGQGQALSDELDIMIEAADNLAERLQTIASSTRKAVGEPAADKTGNKQKQSKGPRSRAERELVEALKTRNDKG